MNPTSPGRKRLLPWLFVSLSGADLALTWWLLRGEGIYEANPLARRILESFGWLGLASFKLCMVLVVLGLLALVGRQRPATAHKGLQLACLLVGLVVVYSLSLAAVTEPLQLQREKRELRAEAEREQRIEEEFHRSRTCMIRLRELARDIVLGGKSVAEAVAELEQTDGDNDPSWMRRLLQMNPELTRRQVLETRLVRLAEELRQQRAFSTPTTERTPTRG